MGMDDLVERALPRGVASPREFSSVKEGEDLPSASRVPTPSGLVVEVLGIPAPKGSKSLYRGRLVESSKRYAEWAETVRDSVLAASIQTHYRRIPGPKTVILEFRLPRPQRPKDKDAHITKPDLDKLVRAVLDACTGILWDDDAQVDVLHAYKVYAEMEPGVLISVVPSS